MNAAKVGKEKRDAALESGETMLHPYKNNRFQPKIVGGVKKSLVLLGSAAEADMLLECKKFISFIASKECVSQNNNTYTLKCDCRKPMVEENDSTGVEAMVEANIQAGAEAMVQYYTLSQFGRDVSCQNWVRRNWILKGQQHFKKLGMNRKQKKVKITGKSKTNW